MITPDKVRHALHQILSEEITKIIEEESQKAEKETGRRIRAKVGEISTRIASCYQVERLGDDLRITVRIQDTRTS
jgi:hypothetical protein